ncbi:MAG: response regulator transcription factor [Thermomicrobium sp.]|nr:response regulator transcription factor [Thermomicrobium sp.]MDW7981360.1 response regulator transcription factor [Thermomicrobium sp.]
MKGKGSERQRGIVRVMVVDDHPLFRFAVRQVLDRHGRFLVVAEAASAHEAVRQAELHRPDLALVDVRLPGINGLHVVRLLKRQLPKLSVVLLSADRDEQWLLGALQVGAAAFVPKDSDPREMLRVVEAVSAGEDRLPQQILENPELARRVLGELQRYVAGERSFDSPETALTVRELQVLDCVAQGMSNKEIADALFITEQTVKNHMTSILRKLGAQDRVDVILAAVRHRWVAITPLSPLAASA